jgi:hypothetical protein
LSTDEQKCLPFKQVSNDLRTTIDEELCPLEMTRHGFYEHEWTEPERTYVTIHSSDFTSSPRHSA